MPRKTVVCDAIALLAAVFIALIGGTPAWASDSLRLELIGKFSEPVQVAQPVKRGKIYVIERKGVVRVIDGGNLLGRPFLDLRRKVNSKNLSQGLLSIAFAPDFRTSGLLYAYFTAGDGSQVVGELRSNAAGTRTNGGIRKVLRMRDFNHAHNGGMLEFGPDGDLYIATGDGGYSGEGDPGRTALDRNSLLGKILRIDPRKHGPLPYRTPSSNPFVGREGKDEVYALGLRNPWRFSIDERRGLIAIGDVGNKTFEEINITSLRSLRGANFGWSAYEAFMTNNLDQLPFAEDRVDPVHYYSHERGCSVTGGVFVRDRSLPTLLGRYVYADYCSNRLMSFRYRDSVGVVDQRTESRLKASLVTSFGQGALGQVWVSSFSGEVFRIRQR